MGSTVWKPIWTNGAIKKMIFSPRTALNRYWVGAFGYLVERLDCTARQTITRIVNALAHRICQSFYSLADAVQRMTIAYYIL
jgi:hypothetical protein